MKEEINMRLINLILNNNMINLIKLNILLDIIVYNYLILRLNSDKRLQSCYIHIEILGQKILHYNPYFLIRMLFHHKYYLQLLSHQYFQTKLTCESIIPNELTLIQALFKKVDSEKRRDTGLRRGAFIGIAHYEEDP